MNRPALLNADRLFPAAKCLPCHRPQEPFAPGTIAADHLAETIRRLNTAAGAADNPRNIETLPAIHAAIAELAEQGERELAEVQSLLGGLEPTALALLIEMLRKARK